MLTIDDLNKAKDNRTVFVFGGWAGYRIVAVSECLGWPEDCVNVRNGQTCVGVVDMRNVDHPNAGPLDSIHVAATDTLPGVA